MRTAFIRSLSALAEKDPSVMLLTGDLGFTVFEDFQARFPDRFLNMGIAEQNMISVAAGLALSGKRVFVYSIIPFVTLRCLEQIRNDLCLHHLPVCIVGIGSGYSYGHMGPSHHALEDIAALRSLPGMTVLSPADALETEASIQSIATCTGPCYLRLGKNGEPAVHDASHLLGIDRAIPLRTGHDVTLMATGTTVFTALKAADSLEAQGLSVAVLSFPTIQPLDTDAIRNAAVQSSLIVSIEEHRKAGGFGSAIAEVLADVADRPRQLFCSAPDSISHLCATAEACRLEAGLMPEQIALRVLAAIERPAAVRSY